MRSRRTFVWVTSTPHFSQTTFVILDGSEYLGAEQPVAFRLERTIVDRFRLLDFAERPRTDHVRRGQPDADRIEIVDRILVLK